MYVLTSEMKNSVSCVLPPGPARVSGPMFTVMISIGSVAMQGNQICFHNAPTLSSCILGLPTYVAIASIGREAMHGPHRVGGEFIDRLAV